MLTYPVGLLNPDVGTLRNGLMLELKYEGNTLDTSSFGHIVTNVGAIPTTDHRGNPNFAYLFDGVNDKMTIPYSANLFNGVFSYSVWVKLITDTPINNWIINSWNTSSPRVDGLFIWLDSGSDWPNFIYSSSGVNVANATFSLSLNTWYHIVAIHGISSDLIYVDADLKSISYRAGGFNAGISTDTPPVWIGARTDNAQFCNMAATKIRKYDRELTQTEIDTLFAE